ncbi:hypothetical protein JCM3766R1_002507 [Sporobolomyces carnicolor]
MAANSSGSIAAARWGRRDETDHESPGRDGKSCLHPGSTWVGVQRSGRNSYDVKVKIDTVDIEAGTLAGTLEIRNLTPELDSLVTFFEGEIVSEHGPGFLTANYGATKEDDMRHWRRFPPFMRNRLEQQMLATPNLNLRGASKKPYLFMRWKERFVLPERKIDAIHGASFAGLYYVCLDFEPSSSELFAEAASHSPHPHHRALSSPPSRGAFGFATSSTSPSTTRGRLLSSSSAFSPPPPGLEVSSNEPRLAASPSQSQLAQTRPTHAVVSAAAPSPSLVPILQDSLVPSPSPSTSTSVPTTTIRTSTLPIAIAARPSVPRRSLSYAAALRGETQNSEGEGDSGARDDASPRSTTSSSGSSSVSLSPSAPSSLATTSSSSSSSSASLLFEGAATANLGIGTPPTPLSTPPRRDHVMSTIARHSETPSSSSNAKGPEIDVARSNLVAVAASSTTIEIVHAAEENGSRARTSSSLSLEASPHSSSSSSSSLSLTDNAERISGGTELTLTDGNDDEDRKSSDSSAGGRVGAPHAETTTRRGGDQWPRLRSLSEGGGGGGGDSVSTSRLPSSVAPRGPPPPRLPIPHHNHHRESLNRSGGHRANGRKQPCLVEGGNAWADSAFDDDDGRGGGGRRGTSRNSGDGPSFAFKSWSQATLTGFYHFACSEPYQQLSLKYVPTTNGGSQSFDFA